MESSNLAWDYRTFQGYIETLRDIHEQSQKTNAHNVEWKIPFKHYDIWVFSLGQKMKVLVCDSNDIYRLNPVLRFDWFNVRGCKFYQVALETWKFVKEGVAV